MRKICVINQKGGVGKTTTAVNLAAGLSRNDKKVLLIDLDPQGNVDSSLKINAEYDLYDALIGKLDINDAINHVAKNLDIITSKETLTKAEYFLAKQEDAKLILKDILNSIHGYDYLIIDCPPSLGMLNQSVLSFCNEAFVPVSTDYLGIDALKKMTDIVNDINFHYEHDIRIAKIIPTMYDRRNKICKESLIEIQTEYPELTSYPIRYNSKLKEAPKHGKSIFSYDKKCFGSIDYGKLVEDVLNAEV